MADQHMKHFKINSGAVGRVDCKIDRVVPSSDAKAADEAAKQWVSENMDAKVVTSFIGNYAWLEFAQQ